jgi:hypothetical protein
MLSLHPEIYSRSPEKNKLSGDWKNIDLQIKNLLVGVNYDIFGFTAGIKSKSNFTGC